MKKLFRGIVCIAMLSGLATTGYAYKASVKLPYEGIDVYTSDRKITKKYKDICLLEENGGGSFLRGIDQCVERARKLGADAIIIINLAGSGIGLMVLVKAVKYIEP
ncbi:hypothetical protein K8S19_13485 [bacterium]|nr:hypothetical protein [bacterium]